MVSYVILCWGNRVSEGMKMSHELNNWYRRDISNLGNVFEKEKWGSTILLIECIDHRI